MSAPTCAQHPRVEAATACGACQKPLCQQCATFEGGQDRCAACLVRYARGKRVRAVLLGVGGVALLGLGGAYAAGLVGPERKPEFDYGSKRPLVVHQREQLEREPCDRTRASEYTQTLASLGDWETTLATVDAFVAKCGPFPALRSLSYAARMRQKDYALALRDADELVGAAPTNASYLVWRAQAHEAAQALEPALADFEKAFELKPGQRQVAGLLAQAYERRERRCDALRVLQRHVQETPASGKEAALLTQMSELQRVGACPPPEAPEAATPEAAAPEASPTAP